MVIFSVRNKSFDRDDADRVSLESLGVALPGQDREAIGGISAIYNIHNHTAESEHEIHLQKLSFTLGKNSVSILFTLSSALQPIDTL